MIENCGDYGRSRFIGLAETIGDGFRHLRFVPGPFAVRIALFTPMCFGIMRVMRGPRGLIFSLNGGTIEKFKVFLENLHEQGNRFCLEHVCPERFAPRENVRHIPPGLVHQPVFTLQIAVVFHFPLPLAAAIGLEAGDEVQWELLDRRELHLLRINPSKPRTAKSIREKTKKGKVTD
ncbi:MAG: hypothetical protein R6X19_08995 [Kiritimatiellia bacterium]